jgi:WD40 repeat protein
VAPPLFTVHAMLADEFKDGRYTRLLATGERGYDSDVCVWELATGAVLHRFQEHDHGIAALGFSDDERLLLSVGGEQDGLVLVWDLSTGAQVTRLRHEPAPVLCVAWGGFVKDLKGRDTALYQFATGGAQGGAARARRS